MITVLITVLVYAVPEPELPVTGDVGKLLVVALLYTGIDELALASELLVLLEAVTGLPGVDNVELEYAGGPYDGAV